MITITSLTHPTMIAKIRDGLKLAALGKGEEMGGHANRVYIANRKGHNMLRLDWKGNGKFVAYGGCDWGQTDVTEIVKEALRRASVKPIHTYEPLSPDAVESIKANPGLMARLGKLALLAGIATGLTGCQSCGAMTVMISTLGGLVT